MNHNQSFRFASIFIACMLIASFASAQNNGRTTRRSDRTQNGTGNGNNRQQQWDNMTPEQQAQFRERMQQQVQQRQSQFMARFQQFVAPMPKWQLIMMTDVRDEIGYTNDSFRSNMQNNFQLLMANQTEAVTGDPEGAFKRRQVNLDEAYSKPISAEGKKRLGELFVQANDGLSVLDSTVSVQLVLTDEQKESIKATLRDSNKLIKDEQTKLEKNIKVEKRLDYNQLCKDCGEKFKALLTEGQLKKLELLKGKEFKFKSLNFLENMGRGGRGGQNGAQNGAGQNGGGRTRGGGTQNGGGQTTSGGGTQNP